MRKGSNPPPPGERPAPPPNPPQVLSRPSKEWYRRRISEMGDDEPPYAGSALIDPAPPATDAPELDDEARDEPVWALIGIAEGCGAVKDEGDDGSFWTFTLDTFFALEAKMRDAVNAMRYADATPPAGGGDAEVELPVLQDLPKCWSGSPITVTWAEDGETTTREVWSEPQVQKVAYEYGERCFLAGVEKGRLASGGDAAEKLLLALAEYPARNPHQLQAAKVCAGVLELAGQAPAPARRKS